MSASSSMSTSDSSKLCPICGATNAKMYYNGLSCVACKSFFVRAAIHTYPYECEKGGKCVILPNEKKNCKGCRYRRCRQVGMDPDLVHLTKKADDAVLPLLNYYELVRHHVVPVLSLGFHFVAQSTYYRGPRQFAQHYMNIDKISVTNIAQEPRFSYFNLNVSLPDVLLNSSLCYSKEEVIPSSPEELLQNIIPHAFCKFLVAFVDFASAVPELRFLSTPDKMRLVQNNRQAVVILRSYFLHHLEPFRLERQADNAQMVEIISPGHAAQMKRLTDFFEEHAAPLFDEIKITEEEMTLLRLIAVVSPFATCSEEGNDILRKAKGKYTNILIGYYDEVFVGITAIQRGLCEELNQRTTLLVVNNVCNVLGPLSYDVQLPAMPTDSAVDKKLCAVCGNPNARYNYGGLTCVSCKSFFIRATLVVFPYECLQNGKCSIVASSPHYCKGCRYDRCIKAGMNPYSVGRRPRYAESVGPITNRQQLIQRHVTPMISLGFRFAAYATRNMGPIQFAKHFSNVDKISLKNAAEDQVNYFNMNVSLVDVFMNSSLCYSHDEVLVVPEKDLIQCIFAHGYCKYLMAFVDFASAVPELKLLSTADTMRLLQNNRNEVAMLRAFYFHHLLPDREVKEKQGIQQLDFISKEQGSIWRYFYKFYQEKVADFLDEVCLTAEEMVLLRLVAMFSTFQDCSDQGLEILRKARGKYTNILIEYQNQMYPEMSPYEKIKRLQTMLRFLTELKDFGSDMHSRYTSFVLNNVDNLLGTLSYDLQVRVYRD